MNKDKSRIEAMKALATIRESDVQAERAIKGYIDLLEGLVQKEINQHAQTRKDLKDVGEWLNVSRSTIDSLRAKLR